MEADHLHENPQTPTARNTSSNHLRLQKADAPSFSTKKSSHQTKRNNKKLPSTSTGFKQQPIQRRPAHAKPDFNWLSAPKNGTWKRTCGISCLRSLAPMWRLRCSTTQATYNTRIKFFLLTSYSNPLPLDSWQVSYESHGGSRISCFALK